MLRKTGSTLLAAMILSACGADDDVSREDPAVETGVFANSGLMASSKDQLWPGGLVPYVVTPDPSRVVMGRAATCSPACGGGQVCLAGDPLRRAVPNHCGPLPCSRGQVFVFGRCLSAERLAKQAGDIWTSRTEGRFKLQYRSARPAAGAFVDFDFTTLDCSSDSIGRPVPARRISLHAGSCNEPLGLDHELGHVLGLLHTNQRSDRDLYLDSYQDSVPSDRGSVGADWGDYDLFSAMHYRSNDFRYSSCGVGAGACFFYPQPWYRKRDGSTFGSRQPYRDGWWEQAGPLPPPSDVSSLVEMYAMEWGWNTPARPEPGWTSSPGTAGWALGGLTTVAAGAAPAVASSGSRMDVFVRGSDGALWQNTYAQSGWSGWVSRGGVIASDPVAVSGRNGRVDVLARSPDNHTWHWSTADGAVYGWDEVADDVRGPAIGAAGAKPAIVAPVPDQPEVFVRSLGALHRYYWSAGWHWGGTWSLGGHTLVGSPGAAATSSDHRIDLFSPTKEGHVWNLPLTCKPDGGCSAGPWADGGGSVLSASAPAAAAAYVNGRRRVDVFVRGPNDMLYWSRKSDTQPFSGGFLFLGRRLTSEPTAVWNQLTGPRLDLFFGNLRLADGVYEIVHKWGLGADLL